MKATYIYSIPTHEVLTKLCIMFSSTNQAQMQKVSRGTGGQDRQSQMHQRYTTSATLEFCTRGVH